MGKRVTRLLTVLRLSRYSLALICIAALVTLGKSIVSTNYVAYLKVCGLSHTQIGSLLGVYFLALGLLDFPTGGLADRYGRKRVYFLGVTLYGAGLIVYGSSCSYPLFLSSEIILALAAALMSGTLSAWYFDNLKEANRVDEAKVCLGLSVSVSRVTRFISAFIAFTLISASISLTFIAGGIIMLIVSLLVVLLMNENYGAYSTQSFSSILRNAVETIRSNVSLASLFAGNMCLMFTQMLFLYSWQILVISYFQPPREARKAREVRERGALHT